jgi:hypothetical protein
MKLRPLSVALMAGQILLTHSLNGAIVPRKSVVARKAAPPQPYSGGTMKTWVVGLGILLLLTVVLTGCQPSTGDGYTVMFAGRPNIWDGAVYHQGNVIGRVVSVETGETNISKAAVNLDAPYRNRLASNTVFYVSNGRLNLGVMGNYGTAVKPGATVAGFGSKSAYRWFKFKHILDNPANKVNKRAQYLAESF